MLACFCDVPELVAWCSGRPQAGLSGGDSNFSWALGKSQASIERQSNICLPLLPERTGCFPWQAVLPKWYQCGDTQGQYPAVACGNDGFDCVYVNYYYWQVCAALASAAVRPMPLLPPWLPAELPAFWPAATCRQCKRGQVQLHKAGLGPLLAPAASCLVVNST